MNIVTLVLATKYVHTCIGMKLISVWKISYHDYKCFQRELNSYENISPLLVLHLVVINIVILDCAFEELDFFAAPIQVGGWPLWSLTSMALFLFSFMNVSLRHALVKYLSSLHILVAQLSRE